MALPDWARAHGEPLCEATIRQSPADFRVTENLAIEFSGDGEHDYLWIEKTGANTQWIARQLARYAKARNSDVGYAGLKDRHAVTRQWFSIPRKSEGPDWRAFTCDGAEILEVARHQRKLRRGAHKGNSFRIALRPRSALPDTLVVEERLKKISTQGVPNYFGPQRFGHNASNLELARQLFAGKRLHRDKRSIAVSAARSCLFNEILGVRVRDGTWNSLLPGEIANLDGSGSVFQVDEPDEELKRRCEEMDIHPTATLWGLRSEKPRSDISPEVIRELELDAMKAHQDLKTGLEHISVKASHRALRLRVSDLSWQFEPDTLWLDFTLPKGAFATSVLRELADIQSDRSST
jgi:tRNA pseudouridine13 synthase